MFTEILGVIIIIGVLLILFLRHSMDKKNVTSNKPKDISLAAQQLEKNLQETGNKILQQMDEKLNQLEKMVDLADKKLEELKRYYAFMAEEENNKSLHISAAPASSNKVDNFAAALDSATQNKYGGSMDISLPADKDIYQDQIEKPKTLAKKKNISTNNLSKTAKLVFAMLDKDVPPDRISRRLSIGRGAVDMIVQIYKKMHEK